MGRGGGGGGGGRLLPCQSGNLFLLHFILIIQCVSIMYCESQILDSHIRCFLPHIIILLYHLRFVHNKLGSSMCCGWVYSQIGERGDDVEFLFNN